MAHADRPGWWADRAGQYNAAQQTPVRPIPNSLTSLQLSVAPLDTKAHTDLVNDIVTARDEELEQEEQKSFWNNIFGSIQDFFTFGGEADPEKLEYLESGTTKTFKEWKRDLPLKPPEKPGQSVVPAEEGGGVLEWLDDKIFQPGLQVLGTPFNAINIAEESDPHDWTGNPEMFLEGDTWAQAWERSEHTHFGRAVAESFLVHPEDRMEVHAEGFDEFGNPVNEAYAELRRSDPAYNLISGPLDLLAVWYASPDVLAGRAVTGARALHKGDLPRLSRRHAERVRHIATTPEEHLATMRERIPVWDRVGRRALVLREQSLALRNRLRDGELSTYDLTNMQAFAQSPQGPTAAHLFREAANARRVDNTTGEVLDEFDDDLFDTTVGAMLGHSGAVRRLELRFDEVGDAMRALSDTKFRLGDEITQWAEEVQRLSQPTPQLAGWKGATLRRTAEADRKLKLVSAQYNLDDAVAKQRLVEEGLKQYRGYEDWIKRAFDEGPGLSMAPRDARSFGQAIQGITSKTYRPTGHSNLASQVISAPRMAWMKRPGIASLHSSEESFEAGSRLLDQTVRYTRGRGLNELAVKNGANSWEEFREKMLNEIAAADTDVTRNALLTRLENLSIAAVANRYGMTGKEAKQLADHVRGMRQSVIRSAEEQAKKSYSQAQVDGKRIDTFRHVNSDGTEEIIQLPVDVTQLRQTFISTDLRVLNTLLKNHKNAIRALLWEKNSQRVSHALEVFNHYWKPSVLFRIGYPVRNTIDDGARAAAANMSFSFMLRSGQNIVRGARNAPIRAHNFYARTRNWLVNRHPSTESERIPAQALRESVGPIDEINEARRNTIIKRQKAFDTWMQRSARADAKGTKHPQTPPVARRLGAILNDLDRDRVVVVDGAEGKLRAAGEKRIDDAKWETAFESSYRLVEELSPRTLHNYVNDFADWLSNRGNGVMVRLLDDGRAELSVARRNVLRDRPRLTPEQELFKSGERTVKLRGYEFAGSMADEGDMMRPANSSDQFQRSLFRSQELSMRDLRADGMRRTVLAGEKDYEQSWVLAVNDQIRHSPIWRRMLDGWDDERVINWLENTAEGRKHARRMAHKSHNPVAWMDEMRAHLNHYLPDQRLRVIARDRELTVEDVANLDWRASRPVSVDAVALKQAAGTSTMGRFVNKSIENIFHWLATVPSDVLVRNPFFDTNYRFHLKGWVDTLDDGAEITPLMRQFAEKQARQYALKQTKRYMFSLADQSELTHFLRFISPFVGAWQESIIRWARIVMERPEAFGRFYLQGWEQSFDKMWGVEEETDPLTGEQVVNVPMPEWSKTALAAILPNVSEEDLAGFEKFSISKQSMNVTLQGEPWWLPGGGPMVQAPAAFFLRNKPEMADENTLKSFAWNWLFPAGRPQNVLEAFAPSWVQQFDRYHAGSDDPVYNNLALLIYKNDYQRMRDSGMAPQAIDKDKLMRESWDKADGVQFFYTASRLGSPFAFRLMPQSQMWIDMARQYRETYGDREGLQRFADEMGEDAYLWWTSLSKSNVVVPPTSPGFKQYKKFREQIERYPELAPVITGMDAFDAEFNIEVYNRQWELPVGPFDPRKQRTQKSGREFIAETEALQGWQEYRQWRAKIDAELAARGLTSIQQTQAQDLMWANFLKVDEMKQRLPGWGREFEQFDTGRGYAYVNTLRNWVESGSANTNRPDIMGVAEYLDIHDRFAAELDARFAAGGSRSIEARSNVDLAYAWEVATGNLVQRNPMFAEIFHRYLERHVLRNGSN